MQLSIKRMLVMAAIILAVMGLVYLAGSDSETAAMARSFLRNLFRHLF
jgi:sulfite exporter TauE/SafE